MDSITLIENENSELCYKFHLIQKRKKNSAVWIKSKIKSFLKYSVRKRTGQKKWSWFVFFTYLFYESTIALLKKSHNNLSEYWVVERSIRSHVFSPESKIYTIVFSSQHTYIFIRMSIFAISIFSAHDFTFVPVTFSCVVYMVCNAQPHCAYTLYLLPCTQSVSPKVLIYRK